MSILDRLRPDPGHSRTGRPAANRGRTGRDGDRSDGATPQPRSATLGRLDAIRDHAVRSHEPTGWLGAALHGMWAALLSWLAIVLPVQAVWVASTHTKATWGDSVRVATDGWVLLHGVALRVPGGELHLVPLGLALVPAAAWWMAGRRLGAVVPRADAASAGTALRRLALPVASLGGGYAVVLLIASLLASGHGVSPVWWQAVPIGIAAPALVGGVAALRTAHRSAAGTSAARKQGSLTGQVADLLRLPPRIRRATRPALVAVFLLTAVASVVLALALIVGHSQVLAVHRALDPGALGGAVLTLGQVGLVPNLTLWALAWIAGPGFAVGVGSLVSPAASSTGVLPLVPVLGAVPPTGALPSAMQAVFALPVLVGVVTGVLCTRIARAGASGEDDADETDPGRISRPVLSTVLDALTAAALACVVLGPLLVLSGGSAGPGALRSVGPSAWHVCLVLFGELAVGAALGAWLTRRRS